jgi:hypothetical protein
LPAIFESDENEDDTKSVFDAARECCNGIVTVAAVDGALLP